MSGHKPFQALADRVTATPEGRERVETYRRLMDAVMTLHGLREERGLTQVEVAAALRSGRGTSPALSAQRTFTSPHSPDTSRHSAVTWSSRLCSLTR